MRRYINNLLFLFVALILSGCVNDVADSEYRVTIIPTYDYEITPLQQGLKLFGERESYNGVSNSKLSNLVKRFIPSADISSTPWCSAFVIECALATGRENSNSLAARSWLGVGECSIDNPRPGDVCVLWRESKSSWKGHVGFFIRYNEAKTKVLLYGGNQGDQASFRWYHSSRILGIRRLRKSAIIRNKSKYTITI